MLLRLNLFNLFPGFHFYYFVKKAKVVVKGKDLTLGTLVVNLVYGFATRYEKELFDGFSKKVFNT